MTVEFTLPYPINQRQKASFCRQFGLNSIYAGKHWAARNEDKKFWMHLVAVELKRQQVPERYFDRPVRIMFGWDDGLDIDNHAYMGKMIVDALKGHLLKDDSRKYLVSVAHEFRQDGCITVRISDEE